MHGGSDLSGSSLTLDLTRLAHAEFPQAASTPAGLEQVFVFWPGRGRGIRTRRCFGEGRLEIIGRQL